MPLELTRARMLSVTPVLTVLTVLLKRELPLCCTPPTTACEVSVGTLVPTFMVAGMLSVAMMLVAEITFVRVVASAEVMVASSSLVCDQQARGEGHASRAGRHVKNAPGRARAAGILLFEESRDSGGKRAGQVDFINLGVDQNLAWRNVQLPKQGVT